MAPVRVFYLITELNVGGAERALARLLSGLDRRRFEPLVACLYGSQSPVATSIRALGVPVLDLHMADKWRLDALWRLYRLLRDQRPALLHTWLFHANIAGRILGRLAGVPIVLCGERTMGMEGRGRYLLNRLTAPLADRIVCVSKRVAEFCVTAVGVPERQVVVIPNGIDFPDPAFMPDREAARKALGLPADEILVATVSRLDPVKRLDVLLSALALLEGVRAVVVGYGKEEQRLKGIAQELDLQERLQFVGYQQDVWPWLAACDVFALSSDWEGMPNAVLEAMGAGLPVVATAAGGTVDVVVDEVTGLLVPPSDPNALAAALERLIHDPDLRDTMGTAGRQRAQRCFSAQRMVEQTQVLYTELLGR